MTTAAQVAALVVAAGNALVAAFGAWCWHRAEPSRTFWLLARGGQGLAVAQVVLAGVLVLAGWEPADGLYWVYALVPVAVSFFAEQLRLASAQAVLDQRGLEDAQAVGRLDPAGQRAVVLAILRRELGVIAVAAGVIAFLALRGAGTA